jgi:hypothetical protein
MIKSGESALVAVPGLDVMTALLFTRSLLVDLRARHQVPWIDKYTHAHLEHTSVQSGMVRYAIVRAACERQKNPYLDGSVLRDGIVREEAAERATAPESSRTNRFAAAARPQQSGATGRANQGHRGESGSTRDLEERQPISDRFASAIERMRG